MFFIYFSLSDFQNCKFPLPLNARHGKGIDDISLKEDIQCQRNNHGHNRNSHCYGKLCSSLCTYIHLQGQRQSVILLAFQYKNRPHILVPGIDEKNDSRGNNGGPYQWYNDILHDFQILHIFHLCRFNKSPGNSPHGLAQEKYSQHIGQLGQSNTPYFVTKTDLEIIR